MKTTTRYYRWEGDARRLRKGCEADVNASGATHVAGTMNYKRKYEAAFPTVKILQAAPGRVSSRAQLEAFGLVAAPEPISQRPVRVLSVGGSWPDYQRCVLGAPMKHGEQTQTLVEQISFTLCFAHNGDTPRKRSPPNSWNSAARLRRMALNMPN
jgi:hypothetical protein